MNIEWIDQMISDVVGVAGELYTTSTKVVYNDALIDLYSTFIWASFAIVLSLLVSILMWKGVKDDKDKEFVRFMRVGIPIVFTICIFLSFCSTFNTALKATKHLTTPEWYALERIERLVK